MVNTLMVIHSIHRDRAGRGYAVGEVNEVSGSRVKLYPEHFRLLEMAGHQLGLNKDIEGLNITALIGDKDRFSAVYTPDDRLVELRRADEIRQHDTVYDNGHYHKVSKTHRRKDGSWEKIELYNGGSIPFYTPTTGTWIAKVIG